MPPALGSLITCRMCFMEANQYKKGTQVAVNIILCIEISIHLIICKKEVCDG
jgi:hypothetical protein